MHEELSVVSVPAHQSYLGKPVDPNTVARVRRSLSKYSGPKTASERDAIIRAKADESLKKQRDASKEYLAWAEKIKNETVPCFKFPEDPKRGILDSDQYIKQKVKTGIKDLRERTHDYHCWIESLKDKQTQQMHAQVEAKLKADETFNIGAAAREQDRMKRDAETQARVVQQQREYWSWLRGMKQNVANRPHSAPAARSSGVESASSMAAKKRKESEAALRQRACEYQHWLQTVSQPKFKLPFHHVVDPEEKQRRVLKLQERIAEDEVAQEAYFEKIRQMEKKHQARIMRSVEQKMKADQLYNEAHEQAAEELRIKMEDERQKRKAIELESRQQLQDMYQRVKDKPLFLEKAYGIVGKTIS